MYGKYTKTFWWVAKKSRSTYNKVNESVRKRFDRLFNEYLWYSIYPPWIQISNNSLFISQLRYLYRRNENFLLGVQKHGISRKNYLRLHRVLFDKFSYKMLSFTHLLTDLPHNFLVPSRHRQIVYLYYFEFCNIYITR